eukprot:TRINITY_DN1095_c0_g1_i3.p1 TRINITY_DN1095_c0_g1~~TRINITY_DN1095_c0_g1_i3.p1  ORF type:complete len:358 (-),score=66.64 TRINITY_DN1095_c0_g1_i3:95-1168(-)
MDILSCISHPSGSSSMHPFSIPSFFLFFFFRCVCVCARVLPTSLSLQVPLRTMDTIAWLSSFWDTLPLLPCEGGAFVTAKELLNGPVAYAIFGIIICWLLQLAILRYGGYIVGHKNYSTWSDNDKWILSTRGVSTIHAVFAMVTASMCIVRLAGWESLVPSTFFDFSFSWWPTSKDQVTYMACDHCDTCVIAISLTAGYMIFDSIASFAEFQESPLLLIHHINIFSCFLSALWMNHGHYIMSMYMLAEVSTPFLHAIWAMEKSGVPDSSPWFLVIGALLIVTFLAGRVWWTGMVFAYQWAFWEFYPGRLEIPAAISGCVHTGLNFYWSGLLIKKVAEMVFGSSKKRENDASKTKKEE